MDGLIDQPSSLEEIEAGIYPVDLLSGCQSALMLFCAGFYGASDCIWAARADVPQVTAVDRDLDRLMAMKALYPNWWYFVHADAYAWPERTRRTGLSLDYEVVTVDPPNAEWSRIPEHLEVWCGIATKAVVLTVTEEAIRSWQLKVGVNGPGDWQITQMVERNSLGTHWMVMQPVSGKRLLGV